MIASAYWGSANEARRIITGITGQDGSYLAELLLEQGYEVHGIVRRSSTENFERIAHLHGRIELHQADLLDQLSLIDVLRDGAAARGLQPGGHELRADQLEAAGADRRVHRPRRHARAGSHPPARPARASASTRPSSSEMFGKVQRDAADARRRRSTRAAPTAWPRSTATGSPSTTARATACSACSGILFNHESPRRGREFVTRKVTDGVARIKLGLAKELRLGNLDAKRDWGFAGDYVQAMWLMLQQDQPDDYVVATGETHSVRELVEVAFGHVGLDWQKYVVQDPALIRPAEVDLLVGDAEQGPARSGLAAEVGFTELVR